MRTNVMLHWNLEENKPEDLILSPNVRKIDSTIVYTIYFFTSKVLFTFVILPDGRLSLNNLYWGEKVMRNRPSGLANLDLETKKAICFFDSFFNYIAESDTYTIHFYFSEAGLKIDCEGLNEEGLKAFMKLYEMKLIIHSKLEIEHDHDMFVNSKCILNPFAKDVIREDDSLPFYQELYRQFSFEDLIEDENDT